MPNILYIQNLLSHINRGTHDEIEMKVLYKYYIKVFNYCLRLLHYRRRLRHHHLVETTRQMQVGI